MTVGDFRRQAMIGIRRNAQRQKKHADGFDPSACRVFESDRLIQQQIRLPANSFGAGAELFESAVLNLAHTLLGDPQLMANLAETVGAAAGQAETQVEHLAFARAEVFHQERQCFDALVVLLEDVGLVIRHRFGQLEIAVVIEDGIQADGRAGRGLQVGEMFETRAGAGSEFLRARQMFPAVSQCFAFLLEQTEFLQVVRAETDEVALASDGDLQCLPNPPRRIRRQASAVAHVESINGLHQAADGFLKEIGIAKGVMAKAFGDVSGEADIGRGEAMFIVHIAIVKPANRNHRASPVIFTMLADELRHRPRFTHRRSMGSQRGEIPNQGFDQVLFAVPKISQQLTLFLGREQIGRKRRERRIDRFRRPTHGAEVTFLPLRVCCHPRIPQKTE